MVALGDRAGAQGEDLRTVEELQEVLDEDEDAEGGDEEDEGWGRFFS